MRYLSDDPISITLHNGLIVWITYEEKYGEGNYLYLVDKNSNIDATEVKKLPKDTTRRMVDAICKSKYADSITDTKMLFTQVVFFDGRKTVLEVEHNKRAQTTTFKENFKSKHQIAGRFEDAFAQPHTIIHSSGKKASWTLTDEDPPKATLLANNKPIAVYQYLDENFSK